MTAYSRLLDDTYTKILYAPKAVTGVLTNVTSLTVPIGQVGSTLVVVFRIGDYTRNEPVTIDMLFQKRASSTAAWVDVATMSMVSPSGVASYGARLGGGQLVGAADVRAILNSTGDIITIEYCADAWVESRRNPLVSTLEVQHPGAGRLVLDLP